MLTSGKCTIEDRANIVNYVSQITFNINIIIHKEYFDTTNLITRLGISSNRYLASRNETN